MEKPRKISQEELQYVYESAQARMASHPEYAQEQTAIIHEFPHFDDKEEALQAAKDMSKDGRWDCQIWAKIGIDEEYYFIENYYIVSDDYKVKQAAEYIGMAHVFNA